MKLVHVDKNFTTEEIQNIEKQKDAKYVGEFTIRTTGEGWVNRPVSIFIQKKPHEVSGSRFFGIFLRSNAPTSTEIELIITNGQSAVTDEHNTKVIYTGNLNESTGEVLYSAYRHDYQEHGDLMIDGGRDYERYSIEPGQRIVHFFITDEGEIEFLEETQLNDKFEPELKKKTEITGWSIQKTFDLE